MYDIYDYHNSPRVRLKEEMGYYTFCLAKKKQGISRNNYSNLTLCLLVFVNKMLQILLILTSSTLLNYSLPLSLKTNMYRHCLNFYNPCTKEFPCTDEQLIEAGVDILSSVTSSVAAGTCLSS